jgi:hypothetical protein
MSLVHNEQTKLTATYLNGLAMGVFLVGGLAPIFSSFYAPSGSAMSMPVGVMIAVSAVCFLLSAALHFMARQVLKDLRS